MPAKKITSNDGKIKATLEYLVADENIEINYRLDFITKDTKQQMLGYLDLSDLDMKVYEQLMKSYNSAGSFIPRMDSGISYGFELLGCNVAIKYEKNLNPSKDLFSAYKVSIGKKEQWCKHPEYLGVLFYDAIKAQMPSKKP